MIGVNLRKGAQDLGTLKKAMSFVFNGLFASTFPFLYNSFSFNYFLASFRMLVFDNLCFQQHTGFDRTFFVFQTFFSRPARPIAASHLHPGVGVRPCDEMSINMTTFIGYHTSAGLSSGKFNKGERRREFELPRASELARARCPQPPLNPAATPTSMSRLPGSLRG
jgi:hypothetical protein